MNRLNIWIHILNILINMFKDKLRLLDNFKDQSKDDIDQFYQSKLKEYDTYEKDVERFFNGFIDYYSYKVINFLDFMQCDNFHVYIGEYIKNCGVDYLNKLIIKDNY